MFLCVDLLNVVCMAVLFVGVCGKCGGFVCGGVLSTTSHVPVVG